MDFSFSWDSMFGDKGGSDAAAGDFAGTLHKDDLSFDSDSSYDPTKSSVLNDPTSSIDAAAAGNADLSTFNTGTQGSMGTDTGYLGSDVAVNPGEKGDSKFGQFAKAWNKSKHSAPPEQQMLNSQVGHGNFSLSAIKSGDVQALPDQSQLVKTAPKQFQGGPFATAFNKSAVFN